MQHHSSQKFSDPDRCTKDNVVPITNKRSQSHSQSEFQLIKNLKMRSKPRVHQAVDHRSKKKQPVQTNRNKRCLTNHSEDRHHRCHMNVRFFMHSDGTWHLHRGSSFEHKFHTSEDEDTTTLNKLDLLEEHLKAMNILFKSGTSPTLIARVMNEMVHMSSEKKGAVKFKFHVLYYWGDKSWYYTSFTFTGGFLTLTIHNIGNQEQAAMDKINGIDADWSAAQRLLAALKSWECNLFFVTFAT